MPAVIRHLLASISHSRTCSIVFSADPAFFALVADSTNVVSHFRSKLSAEPQKTKACLAQRTGSRPCCCSVWLPAKHCNAKTRVWTPTAKRSSVLQRLHPGAHGDAEPRGEFFVSTSPSEKSILLNSGSLLASRFNPTSNCSASRAQVVRVRLRFAFAEALDKGTAGTFRSAWPASCSCASFLRVVTNHR